MPGEVGRGMKYNTQMLMWDLLFAATYFAHTGGRVHLRYHVDLTIFLLYHGPFWYFGLREAGASKTVHNFEGIKCLYCLVMGRMHLRWVKEYR